MEFLVGPARSVEGQLNRSLSHPAWATRYCTRRTLGSNPTKVGAARDGTVPWDSTLTYVVVSVAVADSSPGEFAVTRIDPARAVVCTTARHSPLNAFRTAAL